MLRLCRWNQFAFTCNADPHSTQIQGTLAAQVNFTSTLAVSEKPILLTEQSFKVLAVSEIRKLLTNHHFKDPPVSEKPKLLTNHMFKGTSVSNAGITHGIWCSATATAKRAKLYCKNIL